MSPEVLDQPRQHEETLFLQKQQQKTNNNNTKIIWAWWRVPVIPATQEAEAELPEPRRRRLQ